MISANLTSGLVGGRGEPDSPPAPPPKRSPVLSSVAMQPALAAMPAIFAAAQPAPAMAAAPAPEPAPAAAPAASVFTAISPALSAAVIDRIRPDLVRPTLPLPLPLPQPNRTTTQLARGAATQLKNSPPASVNAAINSATSREVRGEMLMPYLERKTRIGEVLNDLAARWSDTTKSDFADAFNMPRDQLDVMDAIVSLAILSDKDLEPELRAENLTAPTSNDLLENRRIVWQSVPAGTPWQPPYLMVVAVEYEDVAKAQDVVQSIVSELVWSRGFRMPKAVADRL